MQSSARWRTSSSFLAGAAWLMVSRWKTNHNDVTLNIKSQTFSKRMWMHIFGDRRDAIHTNTFFTKRTSSPDCRKHFTHKAVPGSCECSAIQYTRANRCIRTSDAQLLQQTSYNSPQGQEHKESRYHSLFLLSALYYQYNTNLTRWVIPGIGISKTHAFLLLFKFQPDMSIVHADLKFNKYKVT